MPSLPSICVMIPTYNQAGFVANAVESVLQQDYPNVQIVVADDSSTDNTEAILAPFIEQGKIQYYKHQPNIGRVANYRKCLYEYATTDWVVNLDGDDYYTNPSYLSEAMHAIMQAGVDDVLFYQGVNVFKTADKERLYQTGVQGQQILSGKDYFFTYFRLKHFSHMSALYNRKAAIASGFYEKDAISSDIYSFMKLGLNNPAKKVILSNKVSGVWLQHGENASRNIQLKKHWQNYQLYGCLYRLALQKGYNWLRCMPWRLAALMEYTRIYLGALARRFAS